MLNICRYCDARLSTDVRGVGVCESCKTKPPAQQRRADAPAAGELSGSPSQACWGCGGPGLLIGTFMLGLLAAAVLLAAPFLF